MALIFFAYRLPGMTGVVRCARKPYQMQRDGSIPMSGMIGRSFLNESVRYINNKTDMEVRAVLQDSIGIFRNFAVKFIISLVTGRMYSISRATPIQRPQQPRLHDLL